MGSQCTGTLPAHVSAPATRTQMQYNRGMRSAGSRIHWGNLPQGHGFSSINADLLFKLCNMVHACGLPQRLNHSCRQPLHCQQLGSRWGPAQQVAASSDGLCMCCVCLYHMHALSRTTGPTYAWPAKRCPCCNSGTVNTRML